jgi:ubiquinone/menaquinone biosynthesis C-methylase UbiE
MRRIEFLKKYLKEGTILDIGNLQWNGALHASLIKDYPRSTFYGLDIMDQNEVMGHQFANQYVGSCVKMPFKDGMFDTIYAGQLIEHVWEIKQMADECFRVLKSGGVLVVDTPSIYSLSRMLRYGVTGKDVILGNPEHKIFFSFAILENLLLQAGFQNVVLRTENNFAFRSKLYRLPDCRPFTYLGECIFAAATK